MKIYGFVTTLLSLLLCGTITQAQQDKIPGRAHQKIIQELEQAIHSNNDPQLSSHDRLWRLLKEQIKYRITLQTDTTYYAAEIYICRELSGDFTFRCSYLYADDSIHLPEFPEIYTPLPWPRSGEKIQVQIAPQVSEKDIEFYLGDTSEMHRSGYRSVKRLNLSKDGILTVESKNNKHVQVLFTIVKGNNELFYKKYVMVA